MTTLTPPPERELPSGLRAAVLDAIEAPARPARRWIPVAAAPAVAVSVAVPVVVLADRDGPPPAAPAATPTPSLPPWTPPAGPFPGPLPDGQTLVRRCVDAVPAGQAPAVGGLAVRAVHTDSEGYVAWVGGGGFSTICSFAWDGEPDLVGGFGGGVPEPTWAPEFDVRLSVSGVGGSDPKLVTGTVSRGVRRVELRWGTGRSWATVRGPYFVGRIAAPAGGSAERPTARAYGADGTAYAPVTLPGAAPTSDERVVLPREPLVPVEITAAQRALVFKACDGYPPGARVVSTVRTEAGFLSVVATGGRTWSCGWLANGQVSSGSDGSSGDDGVFGPIRAPISFDGGGSSMGVATFHGKAVAGVRKVTLTFADGRRLDATVTKGTWIAAVGIYNVRFGAGEADEMEKEMGLVVVPQPTVRAYGDGGTLLYDSTRGDVSCPQGSGKCTYPWP